MVMSRKARLTVFRDKIEAISNCPHTVFNELEPSDKLVEMIESAEGGDILAMKEILIKLHAVSQENNRPSDALLYFLKLGLKAKDPTSAAFLINYIANFNTAFELLDEAIATVKGSELDEYTTSVSEIARTKQLLAAPSVDCDFAALKDSLRELDPSPYQDIVLYLSAKELEYKGVPLSEEAVECARLYRSEELLKLPVFTGKSEVQAEELPKNNDSKCNMLNTVPTLFNLAEWGDFWVKVMYEYAMTYLGGDLTVFTETMLTVVSNRPLYPEKLLHEFALKKYALEHGLDTHTLEECDALEIKCRFNGLDVSASIEELIKDAVYTRYVPTQSSVEGVVFDAEIQHERNRYRLETVLTDHKKRASRHRWESVIAIRTDEDVPPTFEPIPIVSMNAEISRNGIKLVKEKKASQVLCEGHIQIGDKVSPFELDLILDISYVSATKCTHCGIKIERFKRQGEYLIMQTDVSLYAKDT